MFELGSSTTQVVCIPAPQIGIKNEEIIFIDRLVSYGRGKHTRYLFRGIKESKAPYLDMYSVRR